MQAGTPSRTALRAAGHRAAHQFIERGVLFRDPLAIRILGDEGYASIERDLRDAGSRPLRMFIATRSRYADDALQRAIARGVHQLVLLGAGLDTFAYRGESPRSLRIYEVDHPSTQEWKRAKLAAARISVPESVVFTPIDFERHGLAESLAASGFDPTQPAFFTWMGSLPYLTEESALSTLGYIARLAGGAHVVFDYINPPEAMSEEGRAAHDVLASRVCDIGEMFRTFWRTPPLHAQLRDLGFRQIEDLSPTEIVGRILPGRVSTVSRRGGRILHTFTGNGRRTNTPECF